MKITIEKAINNLFGRISDLETRFLSNRSKHKKQIKDIKQHCKYMEERLIQCERDILLLQEGNKGSVQ